MMVEKIDEADIDFMPRLNYTEIAETLRKRGKVFLYIKPKTAYYARRRLQEVIGSSKKVEAFRAVRKGDDNREVGYYVELV